MRKINKKIPGLLPPPPKTEIDGKITNLSSKSIAELVELRDRQLKLLSNKTFVSKLEDKGTKISEFLGKIENELKAKQEEVETCRMLSNLKLNVANNQDIHQLEWTGKLEKNQQTYLDSDDDSDNEDVLNILRQTTAYEKKIKVLEPVKFLVTAEDLLKIDDHVKYIVDKTELNTKTKPNPEFKPYKTTKSDTHDTEKEILRGKGKSKKWEVTAATPPPIVHGPAKILSIEDSLKLQHDYNLRLKQISAQHAAERLASMSGIKMAELPEEASKFGSYRDVDSDDSDAIEEGSDKEVHDEEPERGGVIFTVMK